MRKLGHFLQTHAILAVLTTYLAAAVIVRLTLPVTSSVYAALSIILPILACLGVLTTPLWKRDHIDSLPVPAGALGEESPDEALRATVQELRDIVAELQQERRVEYQLNREEQAKAQQLLAGMGTRLDEVGKTATLLEKAVRHSERTGLWSQVAGVVIGIVTGYLLSGVHGPLASLIGQ